MPSIPSPGPNRPSEIARLELTRVTADAPLAKVFQLACEISSRIVEAERAGVWLFTETKTALRCVNLYERSKGEHSMGMLLHLADYPNYFASLCIRKALPAELAAIDPRTAELCESYLHPLGISSILDAGIFVDGELLGMISYEHVGAPREWTTETRDFASAVADLVALKIQSAEVQELRSTLRSQTQRLADLEKAEALAQLAAGVAHDFKNILTIVQGFSGELANREDLPDDARDAAQLILDAGERGNLVIKELLAFARPELETPVVVNPRDLMNQLLPVLQAGMGGMHQIRYIQPLSVGQILIEPSHFTRILLNLVTNSKDAMPDGGKIEVQIAPVKVSDRQGLSRHYIMVSVKDEGVGMDAGTLKHMFDPYYTTKSTGTGLGLAIVQRMIDRAGGMIRVASKEGEGTTIRIFFPRVGASSGETIEYSIPPGMFDS